MRVLASETAVWEAVRDLPLDALFPMRAGSCVLEGGSAVRAGATLRVDCLDGTAWRCAVEDRDQDRRRISWTERPLEGAEDPSAAMRWFAIAVTAPQGVRNESDVEFSTSLSGKEAAFLRQNLVLSLGGTERVRRLVRPLAAPERVPCANDGPTPASLYISPRDFPDNARYAVHSAVQLLAAAVVPPDRLGRSADDPDKARDPPALPGDDAEAQVLDAATGTFTATPWRSVRVGDIVELRGTDHCPADGLLLWSTSPLETGLQCPGASGRADALLRRTATLPNEGAGDEDSSELLARLGSGDAAAVAAVRGLGTFLVPPPRTCTAPFHATFTAPSGATVGLDRYQLVPRHGRLVMTERALVLVTYTGPDTRPALHGGDATRDTRHRLLARGKHLREAQKKAEEGARRRQRGEPADPAQLAAGTGIEWEDRLVDVPDDGNCLAHAFWLGLKTLLERRPDLRLPSEPPLPDDPAEFRQQALASLRDDEPYRNAVASQLQLFLMLDAAELFTMEDFFTLPDALQSRVAELNHAAQTEGYDSVDFPALLAQYMDALARPSTYVDGQPRFVPLGAPELDALLRKYQVRLQVIKSEAIDAIRKWHSAEEGEEAAKERHIDPRTIGPRHAHDQSCPGGSARVVRILNINSNHYHVHLPTDAVPTGR